MPKIKKKLTATQKLKKKRPRQKDKRNIGRFSSMESRFESNESPQ